MAEAVAGGALFIPLDSVSGFENGEPNGRVGSDVRALRGEQRAVGASRGMLDRPAEV